MQWIFYQWFIWPYMYPWFYGYWISDGTLYPKNFLANLSFLFTAFRTFADEQDTQLIPWKCQNQKTRKNELWMSLSLNKLIEALKICLAKQCRSGKYTEIYLCLQLLLLLDSCEGFFESCKVTTNHRDSHWRSEDLDLKRKTNLFIDVPPTHFNSFSCKKGEGLNKNAPNIFK